MKSEKKITENRYRNILVIVIQIFFKKLENHIRITSDHLMNQTTVLRNQEQTCESQ